MAAWLTMKIISWKLWLPDHSIPAVPFVNLPPPIQIFLLASFFVIALLLFIKPLNRCLLLCLLITEIISLLGDELRWQPWLYQFLFIAFAVFINAKKPKLAINSIVLILASTYFFSGLQKLNSGFLQTIWLRLMLVKFLHFSNSVYGSRFWRYAGLLVPLFEVMTGVLLLLPKQRKIFAWLPIGMHLFILLFLSPLGIRYNMIVMPWNAAMAGCVYILFIMNTTAFSFAGLLSKSNWIVALAWLILPVAGLFGYWDRFFSSSIYSGNNRHLVIYIKNSAAIPPELLPFVSYSKARFQDVHSYINVTEWCLAEFNVPPPPEKRISEAIELQFQKKYGYLQPLFYYR